MRIHGLRKVCPQVWMPFGKLWFAFARDLHSLSNPPSDQRNAEPARSGAGQYERRTIVLLRRELPSRFFSLWFCKILILLMLWLLDRSHSRQDIEPEELTRKVFWNKELAGHFAPLFGADL